MHDEKPTKIGFISEHGKYTIQGSNPMSGSPYSISKDMI